jgi:hypothetical protein
MITHRDSTLKVATRIARVDRGKLEHMPTVMKAA